MDTAWAAIVVALIALIGVIVSAILTWRAHQQVRRDRRSELTVTTTRAAHEADDTERRDRRRQASEIYQWAAEMAVSEDPRKSQVGVDALKALLDGDLLDEDVKLLVETALTSAYAVPRQAIESALKAEQEILVYQVNIDALEAAGVSLREQPASAEDQHDEERGSDG